MNDIDVMSTLRNLLLSIFYAPLLLQLRFGDGKKLLAELENGCRLLRIEKQRFKLGYLISHYPEWKNLVFYRRYRFRTNFLQYIYKPYDTFFIRCPEIGDGIMLWHPFSTIISCERIGKNFTIRNNITIGNKGTSGGNRPVIGDNVDIGANCSIIGNIRIGNNVTIGAGSVVVKDVPDNVVIAGNPAKILKYKSSK